VKDRTYNLHSAKACVQLNQTFDRNLHESGLAWWQMVLVCTPAEKANSAVIILKSVPVYPAASLVRSVS
jgi:hypothetical protein